MKNKEFKTSATNKHHLDISSKRILTVRFYLSGDTVANRATELYQKLIGCKDVGISTDVASLLSIGGVAHRFDIDEQLGTNVVSIGTRLIYINSVDFYHMQGFR